jgi:tRNA (guanosine-2'-O-)-methyltransferase
MYKDSEKNMQIDPGLEKYLAEMVTQERRDKFAAVLDLRTRYLTAVIEDVRHAQNAGAVVRSCECFGVQEMQVIENEKKFILHSDVVCGSGQWVNVTRWNKPDANNTKNCLEHLKSQGYAIAATSLRDDLPLMLPEELPLDKPLALCLGNEEFGLSDQAHELADYYVRIPMYGFTRSLNISVSAALCIRVLIERLHASDIDWHLTAEECKEITRKWVRASLKQPERLISGYYSRKRLRLPQLPCL